MERCSPSYLLKLSSLPPGRRAHFASCNDCLITSQVCDAKNIILPLQNKLEPCRSWKCGGSPLSKSRNSQSEWAEREASVIQMVHTFYTCSFDIAVFFSFFFNGATERNTATIFFFSRAKSFTFLPWTPPKHEIVPKLGSRMFLFKRHSFCAAIKLLNEACAAFAGFQMSSWKQPSDT